MCMISSKSSQITKNDKTKILHVAGSTKNDFYFDLSLTYCRECDGCLNLNRDIYEFAFAIVHLDGTWSFPENLQKSTILDSKRFCEEEALEKIREFEIDVMVPHMFCTEGVTYYRSLFDKIEIPFVGNKEDTILIAIDKGLTKDALKKAGVQVPKGEILTKGDNETPQEKIMYPCIVKPASEDNSLGLSLVKAPQDLKKAIDFAFSYCDRILVDEYIPGREMRVGVIEEKDGTLTVLPKLEYFVDDIRTTEKKLALQNGKLTDSSINDAKVEGDRQCPAKLSSELEERINEQVLKAHKAMKCTHYSLWDMRVNEEDQPFILESCLFCSFAPLSVIPTLGNKAGREDLAHPEMFHMLLDKAAANKK